MKVDLDALEKAAQETTPETRKADLFADGKYIGKHEVAVPPEQKMREIIHRYFGTTNTEDWEKDKHGMMLASMEEFHSWLGQQAVMVNPAEVLALVERAKQSNELLEALKDVLTILKSGDQMARLERAQAAMEPDRGRPEK